MVLVACDSAEWNGVMYDTSGLYVDTLQSIGGCDSIATLDLTINESYDDVVDTLYRCVGDSALLAGSYQTVSGVYVDTLQSASGCDSIVSTTLIVDTVVYSTTDLELCYGDSALFGGVMYDTSGVYVDTLSSVSGCDSIATLNLTIKELNVGDTLVLVACDSAEWNGVMYDTSGLYVDTLQSIGGCDSIATLNLTIKELNVGDTLVLVACDSAEWNGVMYDTSGLYVDTLSSVSGCDSIATLDLTINESYDDVVDTLYRCVGDSALLAGKLSDGKRSVCRHVTKCKWL